MTAVTARFEDASGQAVKSMLAERKRAEEGLRESEELFSKAFLLSPDCVVISRASDRVVIRANEALCRLWGSTPEKVIGKTSQEFANWLTESERLAFTEKLHEKGECLNHETTLRMADGRLLEFSISSRLTTFKGEACVLTVLADITERKRSEAAAAHLAAIVQFSDDAIIGKDLNGIVTSWNQGAEKLFGYSAAEMVGSSMMRLIPDDRQGEGFRILERVIRGESVPHFETVRQTRDGRLIDVSITASPIKDAAGKVIGLSKVARDITGRKQAEQARGAAEARYQRLVEQSVVGIYIIQDGQFVYVNPRMAEIFGFSQGELTSAPVTDFIFEEDRPLARENIRKRMEGVTESIHYWLRMLRKDGRVIYAEVHGGRSEYNGRPAILGTLLDITERKMAEHESERRSAEIQFILDAVPALVFYKDRESRFLRVNRGLSELMELPPEAFLGKTDAELGSPDGERYREDDLRVMNTGKPLRHREEPLQAADGLRWLLTDKVPYRDDSGRITGVIGFAVDITARKLAEEKLAQERNLLRTLIDSMPDVVFTKDLQGRMLISNPAHVRFAGGATEASLVGKTVFDLFPAEMAEAYHRDDTEVFTSGQPVLNREEPCITRDGIDCWLTTTKVPLRNQAGEITGLIGVSRDITDRKQAEAAIRESEEYFHFLADLSDATRTLTDPEQIMAVTARMLGRHLRASRCAYADVEQDSEQFIILHDYTDGCASTVGRYELSLFGPRAVATLHRGRTLIIRSVEEELLPDEGADMFNAIGIKAIITCPLVKNGGLRAMMAVHQTTPRDWKPGEITIVQDVVERCWATIERRTSEEKLRQLNVALEQRVLERTAQLESVNFELRRSRAELKSLFESLPGLYLVLTPDLTIVAASDAYLKATMTTRESIIGRGLFEVLPDNPDDPEATGSANLRASLGRVRRNAAPDTMAIQKYDVRGPDGVFEEHYWSPVNSPVLGADGRIDYIIHRVEEVTEFVRQKSQPAGDSAGLRARMEQMEAEIFQSSQSIQAANQQLEAANKELEAFSYSISHDLRAPLRAVNGFAEIVLEEYSAQLPDEGRRYLERIRKGGCRMGELIDDLLAFSRLSRQPINRHRVDINKLVHTVVDGLKPRGDERQIEWRIADLPSCQGDPALLKQVWINLISNAIKYSKGRQPAIVEIGCTGETGGGGYFVRDNGAGFDMRYAAKLFGVFQRLHRADEFEGTGVGLAIVQRIVHRHGGRVRAEAEVDKGATFYFTLEGEPAP